MINAGLKELSQALAAKKISSVELSSLFLDRIERLNPDLNAFVTVDREKSLKMAADADARIAAGTAGALTGIPVAQKDIFCAEGWTTTCGSKMLANFVAPYDATVIEKLHAQMAEAASDYARLASLTEQLSGLTDERDELGVVEHLRPFGCAARQPAASENRGCHERKHDGVRGRNGEKPAPIHLRVACRHGRSDSCRSLHHQKQQHGS